MHTEIVKTTLEDGTVIAVEAARLGGEEDVAIALKSIPFDEVTHAIESITESLVKTLKRVKPQRASVELGVAFGVESGALTAVLVKGTGDANLKITLEWGDQEIQTAGDA
jgi:PleD family two-component response regulator